MYNLLVSTNGLLEGEGGSQLPSWVMWIVLGVIVVLLFAWFFFSGRKNKMKQKEYVEQLDAIAPGNKVKTAGGICGVVTEVCDDNTVIIKTGSEESGYSFVKMEKELIAQTDAKGPTQIAREEAEEKRRLEKAAAEAQKKAAKTDASEAPAKDEEPAKPAEAEAPAEEKAEEPETEETPSDEPKDAE